MHSPLVGMLLGCWLATAGPLDEARSPASPAQVLGFGVGEDRMLADWRQIVDYFRQLAESERVLVEDVGPTTEGRPFLVVTITSAENMQRLDELRRDNLRLADPRDLTQAEAEALIAAGKTIVATNHGIHSTEAAASQTAMELAHLLATSQEAEILDILASTVVVMIPSHNPDGTQRVVEWYRQTLDTPYEGGTIPFLYQKYTGHDNNRDWYMFTQVESRLTVEHVYDRWRPQIVHDLHQMGSRSARLFVPPYVDPWEPNVDPALIAAVNALGSHIAARLTGEGRQGVVTAVLFDAWTPARAYPHTHGGVRLLSECASARLASPLELAPSELESRRGFDPRRATWNHPAPWPGGRWRLRDVVDYQLAVSVALLEHAARHRDFWLENFLAVNERACSRQEPFAFVVPADQADPLATARLLEVLLLGAVEVQRARAPFETNIGRFAKGTHVIHMQQPFSAFAKTLLEPQDYPGHGLEGGSATRPYDVTAHTLPLLMGVRVVAIGVAFDAELEPLEEALVPPGQVVGGGRHLAMGHGNAELIALGRLLRAGVGVRWTVEGFVDEASGRSFPAGTLLVPTARRDRLKVLARELGLSAHGVDAEPEALLLRAPRIGLYQSWVPSMDEGWTRFVFEQQLGVDYTTLHDDQIRAGGLAGAFDAIVLPDQKPAALTNGHALGALPDEYVGGLGAEGVAGLREFVLGGGTLVTFNNSSLMAIDELDLPLSNVLEAKDGFSCPGALLRVRAESSAHPLGHGLGGPLCVWFQNGPAFRLDEGIAVASYAEDAGEGLLLSGFLDGADELRGHAALAEVPLGRGRVVLFGFRPQYRAQSWATYVPLLNALYTSAVSR